MRFFAVISPALLAALVSLSLPARDQAKPAFGITSPVMFDTPEADRILSTLQVFPPDNPWNEVIADRPLDPRSGDIVRSIGRDERLGFNLDMNFVIVPPDQPRCACACCCIRTSPTRGRSRFPTLRQSRTGP